MGHSSVRAALIYRHLVYGRDHAIAAHVDEQIKKVRPGESGDASGTALLPRLPGRGTNKAQAPGSVPVTWAFIVLPTGGRGRFRIADICFVSSRGLPLPQAGRSSRMLRNDAPDRRHPPPLMSDLDVTCRRSANGRR